MHKRTSPKVFGRAKELHRNMTEAESKLWAYLRAHPRGETHFRNQHAIGSYIVDFCAPRRKLIIEVDGSQHLEQKAYDLERTNFFQARGYRVLRFWNEDVLKNIDGVMAVIIEALDESG